MGRAGIAMLSLVSSGVLALWLDVTGILPPPVRGEYSSVGSARAGVVSGG